MPADLDDELVAQRWREGLRELAEPGDPTGAADRVVSRARVRRRRHRLVAAILVVCVAAIGVGVTAAMRSGSTRDEVRAGASRSPVRPAPGRFSVRPVVATNSAPCTASQLAGGGRDARLCYTLGPPVVDGNDVVDAAVQPNPGDVNAINILITLTPEGLARFNDLAARVAPLRSPANEAAFVVDGQVVAAPVFQARHFSGGIEIQADWSLAEARHLAAAIGVPPPTTPTKPGASAATVITNPCRYLTLADATRLFGTPAQQPFHLSDVCNYIEAPGPGSGPNLSLQMWHARLRLPRPGPIRCAGTCPELSVQPSGSGTAASTIPTTVGSSTSSRPPDVWAIVQRVNGLGDQAVWLALSSGGQLEVQVGATGIRITVSGSHDDERLAIGTARVVIGHLGR